MTEKKFKYYDVYNRIKQDLISGKYPQGSALPTENELMEIYGASKTTVRHAARLLAEEKYIEVKQGRGTIVLKFSNYNTRKRYKNQTKVDVKMHTDGPGITINAGGYIDVVEADTPTAAKLGIRPGAQVYRFECLHLVDGRAYGFTVSYYREDLFPGLEKLKFRPAEDFYNYLSSTYELKIQKLEDKYAVAQLEEKYAVQLGLQAGSPVMEIKRTGHCTQGVFMYADSFVRTDIYEMVVTLDEDYLYRNVIQ